MGDKPNGKLAAYVLCGFLCGCGGSSGSGPAPPTYTPSPKATYAPILLSPQTVAFTAVPQSENVTVSEAGYGGSFSIANANPSVAEVTLTSSGQYVVSSRSAGTTTIQFIDVHGQAATLAVGVTTSSVGVDAIQGV